jgi:hypothetical protein
MLIIRAAQMEVFRRASRAEFEERTYRSMLRLWPRTSAELGGAKVRDSIHLLADQAEGYGLVTERDVFRFINLRYFLGDPLSPEMPGWMTRLLEDTTRTPAERLDAMVAFAQTADL